MDFLKIDYKNSVERITVLAFLPCNSQHILILKRTSLQLPDNAIGQNNEAGRAPTSKLYWVCRNCDCLYPQVSAFAQALIIAHGMFFNRQ